MANARTWDVLLIGGASRVGKTSVSYRIARHAEVGITEVDDFQVILERMTDPERYPELHLWRRDPEAFGRFDEDAKFAFMVRYTTIMAEPIEYVIANHLRDGPPIVLEGDFLLPSLAAKQFHDGVAAMGRARAIFIHEPDEGQIDRNYLAREGEEQADRARLSWRYSEWLREEAERLGIATLAARPWDSIFERALALL